ncbi:peptidylprolyl isomerase [Desertivirga brevis]|uniref:peptidylprolyl isomerase n=1 Tax=Desertivirga brevis TaxID=2810310 RepID=UPI001A9607FA|nr:peptidylprolyl isomerase [Pedobacter sp. SYSU D00873]
MRKILGVIAILITSLTNIYAQRSINKIVAVVGDNVILQSDIERDYANYILQGNSENPEVKCYLVQQMLTQKLLSQQAVIDSVTVTDDDVSGEVDRRMRVFVQRAGGQERLEKFLNRSVLQYKDEIRPDVREQMIAEKMRSKITENVAVTPLEVKRYFDSIPKDSLPYYNTEVEIGEIVIHPKLTKQEKESFRDKAESLRLRVKGGESFETLASVYSQDPGSAPEGGDLGFFDRTAMVKEFSAMAFKLKAGEISPVFETEYGFHVLQVVERRGEQVHARHILIKTEPTNASLDRTKAHIDSIHRDVVAGKLPFATAASLFSDNNDTKFSGGMLLNSEGVSSRTTYIPTDKLDPSVFLTVDTMKVGTYSKPELFTSKEGKQGYRFFYLKSKTQPHQANLDQDFPKLKEDAYQDKLNKKASEWFEKKRKSTYVKIDPEFQSCSSLKLWTSTN